MDEIDREVLRPTPRDLSTGQLAWRGKKMKSLHDSRNAVKAVVQPGDSFPWAEPEGKDLWARKTYTNTIATIDRFQDEWCWIKFTWPDGKTLIKNIGFKRVAQALKFIGKINYVI
jgi:hypothetical protein